MATSNGQYTPVFLPGELSSLTKKPGKPQSTWLQRVWHDQSDPACIDTRLFCLWLLCPSEGWVWRWCICLTCGDPDGAKCAGTQTASTAGVMAGSVFFPASCSWRSEGLFGQSFSVALPIQALRGLPCLGSFSLVWCISRFKGPRG